MNWYKDNVPISSDVITTQYGTAPNASTELDFAQITRGDRGVYRVVVENRAEDIPDDMRIAETAFDVNIRGITTLAH